MEKLLLTVLNKPEGFLIGTIVQGYEIYKDGIDAAMHKW